MAGALRPSPRQPALEPPRTGHDPASLHGYGVALRIEQISGGVFRVNAGSLLPALSRMERAGHVKSEWRATENNRRAKYYSLTPKGHKALAAETEQWERQTAAIARILEA